MGTLTYGIYRPEDGDKGKPLFEKLEENWQQVNDHNHDGANSAKLGSSSLEHTSQNITSGSWVSQPNGMYRQLVSAVGGLAYEGYEIMCRNTASGDRLYLDTEKVAASQFYIYSNDNSIDVTIYYI